MAACPTTSVFSNLQQKAECRAAVCFDILHDAFGDFLSYIKIYFRTKSTARIYITGVIFSFFPANRFITT